MGLTVAPRSGLVGTISRKKFLNRCDANAIWQGHLRGPVGMLETGVGQHLARRSSSEKIINALPCSSRDYTVPLRTTYSGRRPTLVFWRCGHQTS
jgi:hypothetical protein